jgi:arylsulfatase A-like enzyme
MLGNHGLYAKTVFYEESAKIPLVVMPTAAYDRMGHHVRDDRLTCLADVMPTLLDLCGIPIPATVEGRSLATDFCREYLYGEHWEDARATRMIHDGRHKLIYYPASNRLQMFDLRQDPDELRDVVNEPAYAETRRRLTDLLMANLYGGDLAWARDGALVGMPEPAWQPAPNRGWNGQRGWRFL